jgi:hypothetical protein
MSSAYVMYTLNAIGIPSAPILILNRAPLALRVTTAGLGGGVNADLEVSNNGGFSWSVQASYVADQTNTLVTPANGNQRFRLVLTANAPKRDVAIKLSQEGP